MTSSDTREPAETTSGKDGTQGRPPSDTSPAAISERTRHTFSIYTDDEHEGGRSLAFVYVMMAFFIGVIGIAWGIYEILF